MSFWDFLWLLLIWTPLAVLWGVALADIFRRDDVSGGPKVLWTILVLLLPLLGTLIYLMTRSAGSTEEARVATRDARRRETSEAHLGGEELDHVARGEGPARAARVPRMETRRVSEAKFVRREGGELLRGTTLRRPTCHAAGGPILALRAEGESRAKKNKMFV